MASTRADSPAGVAGWRIVATKRTAGASTIARRQAADSIFSRAMRGELRLPVLLPPRATPAPSEEPAADALAILTGVGEVAGWQPRRGWLAGRLLDRSIGL